MLHLIDNIIKVSPSQFFYLLNFDRLNLVSEGLPRKKKNTCLKESLLNQNKFVILLVILVVPSTFYLAVDNSFHFISF